MDTDMQSKGTGLPAKYPASPQFGESYYTKICIDVVILTSESFINSFRHMVPQVVYAGIYGALTSYYLKVDEMRGLSF